MEQRQFICPKCGCHDYVSDQFQATGGNFDKAAAAAELGKRLA